MSIHGRYFYFCFVHAFLRWRALLSLVCLPFTEPPLPLFCVLLTLPTHGVSLPPSRVARRQRKPSGSLFQTQIIPSVRLLAKGGVLRGSLDAFPTEKTYSPTHEKGTSWGLPHHRLPFPQQQWHWVRCYSPGPKADPLDPSSTIRPPCLRGRGTRGWRRTGGWRCIGGWWCTGGWRWRWRWGGRPAARARRFFEGGSPLLEQEVDGCLLVLVAREVGLEGGVLRGPRELGDLASKGNGVGGGSSSSAEWARSGGRAAKKSIKPSIIDDASNGTSHSSQVKRPITSASE